MKVRRGPIVLVSLALVVLVGGVVVAVRDSRESDRVTVAASEPAVSAPPTPGRTTITFDRRGDTIDLVDGWYRSDAPMAPELVNPSELLSLGTRPFDAPPSRAVCVGNAPPATPIAAMGPDDVFLWLVEWYPTGPQMPQVETSSRRPAHFVIEGNDRTCVQAASPHVRGGSFQFTDRDRVFSLYYVVGNNVTGERAHQVEEVLDSLTFAD